MAPSPSSTKMPGLFSIATMKKHPSVIPVVVMTGFAMTLCAFYATRTALFHPDVKWVNKTSGNPDGHERLRDKQYKFLTGGRKDFSCQAPKYWEEDSEKK